MEEEKIKDTMIDLMAKKLEENSGYSAEDIKELFREKAKERLR